jgi:hypothetical protein
MSILSFFIRFTASYALIMAIVGITMGMLEVESASSLNTPVLFAIGFWCFYSYANKNSRIVAGNEKWKLIFTALAGDVLASTLLAIPTAIANKIPLEFILIGMAIVTPLHLLVFLAVNYVVKKQMLKLKPELAAR